MRLPLTRIVMPIVVAVTVAALVFTVVAAQQAGQDQVQLRAAIKKESVDGDLKGAIAIYQRLRTSADRSVAAQALVRMGQCHEKLGDAESAAARKAYEEVVGKFADQTQAAADARARLGAMVAASAGPPAASPGMRRIAEIPGTDFDTEWGRLSPDGKGIAANDADGSLIIRDVATNLIRRVVVADASLSLHSSAASPIWSPDGQSLAFLWSIPGTPRRKEIRAVAAAGGTPRTLYAAPTDSLRRLADWSPDGRSILAFVAQTPGQVTGGQALVQVSTADGSVRTLAKLAVGGNLAGFSPDGGYLAFSTAVRQGGAPDLYVLPVSGGEPVPVAQSSQREEFVGWTPDGEGVLYRASRGTEVALWVVPVRGGRPSGEPKLLWDALPIRASLGLSRNGTLAFVGDRAARTQTYVATLDLASGKVPVPPAPVDWIDQSALWPAWSPDGGVFATFAFNPPTIVLSDERSRQIRRIVLDPPRPGSLELPRPTWSADGRAIWFASTADGRQTAKSMLVASGTITAIYENDRSAAPPSDMTKDTTGIIAWSPDGQRIYLRVNHRTPGREVSLRERRLSDGEEREIFRTAEPSGITWVVPSPDGAYLAFGFNRFGARPADRQSLEILSTLEGSRRTVPIATLSTSAAWTPDAAAVVVVRREPDGDANVGLSTAWIYPRDGGTPRKTELSWPDISGLAIHPDGRRVAFTGSSPQRATEIWLLENFVPQAAKAGAAAPASAKK